MIVCQFNLSSAQLETLVTFRVRKDTREYEHHGFHAVDPSHTIATMKKLCREGYLEWFPADREAKTPPGYRITDKGEMMLRIVEVELRRNLSWFADGYVVASKGTGAEHDVAAGKAEITPKGRYRRKKAS